MNKLRKIINENKTYEFELQKFIDISSNIQDEELKIRIMAQMIKCQNLILEILKKE